MHAIRACQLRTLPHQLGRYGEGRTWSEHDAEHSVPVRVMIVLDGSLRVTEDCFLVLDHTIGWQATFRFTDRHGTTGGVKAKAHLSRRRDLIVDAGTVRPDVAVVARRRTARKHQLG